MNTNEQTEFKKELTLGQLLIKKGNYRINLVPDPDVAAGRAIQHNTHDNLYYINQDLYNRLVKADTEEETIQLLKKLIIV